MNLPGKIFQAIRLMFNISTAKNYKEYISFAQAGEDRILRYLFNSMGKPSITYLEIGTNNPVDINNTYLFYLGGSRGVCIEPNPLLIKKIKKYRPEDIVLNIGITGNNNNSVMDFYIFDDADKEKGLSTFSKTEAENVERTTHIKIAEVKKVTVQPISEIMETYFKDRAPDFVSLDVEGLDLEILQGIDFNKYRPVAVCVETVNFTLNHKKIKNTPIIEYMIAQNYMVYAESGINTVFADRFLFD